MISFTRVTFIKVRQRLLVLGHQSHLLSDSDIYTYQSADVNAADVGAVAVPVSAEDLDGYI